MVAVTKVITIVLRRECASTCSSWRAMRGIPPLRSSRVRVARSPVAEWYRRGVLERINCEDKSVNVGAEQRSDVRRRMVSRSKDREQDEEEQRRHAQKLKAKQTEGGGAEKPHAHTCMSGHSEKYRWADRCQGCGFSSLPSLGSQSQPTLSALP